MSQITQFTVGFILLSAVGCASSKALIVETESGVLQAVGNAKEESDARMSALDQAQKYCKKRKSHSIFQDKDLKTEGKKPPSIALDRLPVIGQVFRGNDKTQVVLSFRCVAEN